MTTVRIQDVRGRRYCARGIRRWCERHGFDFRELVLNGLPADDLARVGDAMVAPAIEAARAREAAENSARG